MNQKAMQIMLFPGKYIQGNGALKQLPAVMSRYGERSFVVATKSMIDTARGIIEDKGKVEQFNGECCEKEITRVMDLASTYHASGLAAIGGGKVIDCCKVAVLDRPIPCTMQLPCFPELTPYIMVRKLPSV